MFVHCLSKKEKGEKKIWKRICGSKNHEETKRETNKCRQNEKKGGIKQTKETKITKIKKKRAGTN